MNVAHHMRRAGLGAGHMPAIAQGKTVERTYAELADEVARYAGALRTQLHLQPGDRVALVMKNCPEYLALLYAIWHAGLMAVPVNAKLHREEFRYILGHSGTKACFCTPALTSTVAEAASDTLAHIIEVGSPAYQNLGAATALDVAPCEPDDGAWLFYTSGTTGQPKGATLSHRNLLAALQGYFADVDCGAPWRALAHPAPMSHGSGLYAVANVAQAACHVIPESGGFETAEIYELIEHWPGLSFFAAPTMVKRLLEAPNETDTANLKVIMYGGGPMYVEDCLAALDRFGPKLSQLYGQGESPMTITALGPQFHADSGNPRWMERLASVGIAQMPVEVRVVDDDMTTLPTGEIGEVVVKGDSVMTGYWRNPEATAASIVGGWLRTGDVGVFDHEGFLTLKDRSKDMIISGGTNIYPREVEEVLLRHPLVAEVSVIGRPDREWGETVVAYVVAHDDGEHPGENELTALARELDGHCLDAMARFKRPKDYRFLPALPKNNYGKILKTELREKDARLVAAR
jgi:long-chain acyl-CoA synthetase